MAIVHVTMNRAEVKERVGVNGEPYTLVTIILDLGETKPFRERLDVKNVKEMEQSVMAIFNRLGEEMPDKTFKLHISAVGRKMPGFDKARSSLELLHVAK